MGLRPAPYNLFNLPPSQIFWYVSTRGIKRVKFLWIQTSIIPSDVICVSLAGYVSSQQVAKLSRPVYLFTYPLASLLWYQGPPYPSIAEPNRKIKLDLNSNQNRPSVSAIHNHLRAIPPIQRLLHISRPRRPLRPVTAIFPLTDQNGAYLFGVLVAEVSRVRAERLLHFHRTVLRFGHPDTEKQTRTELKRRD